MEMIKQAVDIDRKNRDFDMLTNEIPIPPKMERMFNKLPFIIDWCEYKGEIVVAQINYQESERVGRPMMDISYCMTQALNQNILKTVQFDKSKFKHCYLSMDWENNKAADSSGPVA